LNEGPTPHPARTSALVREWLHRYGSLSRWLLCLGYACVCALLASPVRIVVQEHAGRWFLILLVSWLLCLCLVPMAEICALRVGAVDWPDRRKIHNRPTPRLGGVAIFAALLTGLAANGIWEPGIVRLMICAGLLFALGVADDIRGISARFRLFAQVFLSIVLIHGGLVLKLFPQTSIAGVSANGVLTIFWMVGITNAFNFFDGMDGLACGLGILMAGFLGAIAFSTGQAHLGWVSVAVLGSALGFLPYNFKLKGPASIFMGDGGSTMLGFVLAGLAVHGEWAVGNSLLNLSPPLLIFSVLVYDMIHTTVSRIARGDVRSFRAWIEYTGRDHLHHRFEALLRSKRHAVLTVLSLSFGLGITALVIRYVSIRLALVLLLQGIVILAVVTILERAGNMHERRRHSAGSDRKGERGAPGHGGGSKRSAG
jgi:UDP-GlcNAc:undecaprenyl-phosphate/decaprenyl-phosphate GlcNAc-1-phosphate transferase